MRHWGGESHVGSDRYMSGVLLERLRQALLWSRLPFLHCCKGNKKDGIKQRGQAKRWLLWSRWPVRNLKKTNKKTHKKWNPVSDGGVTKSFSFYPESGGKADMHLHLFAKKKFKPALFYSVINKIKTLIEENRSQKTRNHKLVQYNPQGVNFFNRFSNIRLGSYRKRNFLGMEPVSFRRPC